MKKMILGLVLVLVLSAVAQERVKPGEIIPQRPGFVQDNPKFRSPVPRYTFPETLAAQEKALAENPMVKRMAESRKTEFKHDEKFRTDYHFCAPEGHMGDPNGFCYWKGNYHLFYQSIPPEVLAGRAAGSGIHWGHAVSKDLVHWRDLPYAIYPNPEAACFSGGALVEEDRVIAMYHGTQVGNMIALSDDPLLLNWNKIEDAPVIPAGMGPVGVFDPCIWKEGDYYYSLSGVFEIDPLTGHRVPVQQLFRSENLKDWVYLHPFLENDERYSFFGEDGACPYFWPIGDKHMLVHFSHDTGPSWVVGTYDTERQKLVVENGGRLGAGLAGAGGTHAPSAFPDGNGNVNLIINMSTARASTYRGSLIMGHVMTLPIKLSLIDKANLGKNCWLGFEPVEQVKEMREERLDEITEMKLPKAKEIMLDTISGNAIEIEAEIELNRSVELSVLRSPDSEEVTKIIFYRNAGKADNRIRKLPKEKTGNWFDSLISIDTTQSTLDGVVNSRAPETLPVYLADGENLHLRVFVDKSIVEVFVNGRQYVAMRVYPTREDSVGVSIKANREDATMKKLTAWKMENIWE